MKRIILLGVCSVLIGCSSSPKTPDSAPAAQSSGTSSVPKGPAEIALAWSQSEASNEFRALLGNDTVVERLWLAQNLYNVMVGPPSLGNGTGEAVLVTVKWNGEGWQVVGAKTVPETMLWPGL